MELFLSCLGREIFPQRGFFLGVPICSLFPFRGEGRKGVRERTRQVEVRGYPLSTTLPYPSIRIQNPRESRKIRIFLSPPIVSIPSCDGSHPLLRGGGRLIAGRIVRPRDDSTPQSNMEMRNMTTHPAEPEPHTSQLLNPCLRLASPHRAGRTQSWPAKGGRFAMPVRQKPSQSLY